MKYTYGINGVNAQIKEEVLDKLPTDAVVLSIRPTYIIIEIDLMWDEMRERYEGLVTITKWIKNELPGVIEAQTRRTNVKD